MQDNEPNITPFFRTQARQVIFEFSYLCVTVIAAVGATFWVQFYGQYYGVNASSKALLLSALGGFIGGWTFSTKWFYRVTARGKDNQYNWKWEAHKFYWRMLTPFMAGLVAFDVYLLISSHILPILTAPPYSGRVAFGISFLFGHISDVVLTRYAKWAERILGET